MTPDGLLCDHVSNPVPCANQKSPTAINSEPTTRRTIFMTAPFDRKGAMKKPPGHDARRPLVRLPVSQFRRYHRQRACGAKVPPARKKPASVNRRVGVLSAGFLRH